MIDHRELAREMFYQLALLRFSGMPMAELGGGGVDVMEAIAHLLEASETEDLEESTDLKVSKTNFSLARQATSCLAEKAPMLEEYFSIRFEWRDVQGRSQRRALFLTGLPIVLDGHSPQPHALPGFLIRLATEVDWTAELSCFQGICTEIGSYYAELPVASSAECFPVAHSSNKNMELIEDEAKSYVKHILYPAIAHLVVPPKDFAANGTVLKLANLTSLYKVFERC
jgi:DNA mismatch repair protein MLH1